MTRQKPQPTDPELYQAIKEQIKSQVMRWPSAYASGMLVKKYKEEMAKLKRQPYKENKISPLQSGLRDWFDEGWVDLKTGKPCGSVRSATYYPTCRPSVRISSKTPVLASDLTGKDKKAMISIKQQAGIKTVMYEQTRSKKKMQQI